MEYEIATHLSGARGDKKRRAGNDTLLLSLRGAEGDEAISVGTSYRRYDRMELWENVKNRGNP